MDDEKYDSLQERRERGKGRSNRGKMNDSTNCDGFDFSHGTRQHNNSPPSFSSSSCSVFFSRGNDDDDDHRSFRTTTTTTTMTTNRGRGRGINDEEEGRTGGGREGGDDTNSFFRLNRFLVDHGHDILDLWICREKIRWIRVLSREHSHLFFVDTGSLRLSFTDRTREDILSLRHGYCQPSIYYLERQRQHRSQNENDGGAMRNDVGSHHHVSPPALSSLREMDRLIRHFFCRQTGQRFLSIEGHFVQCGMSGPSYRNDDGSSSSSSALDLYRIRNANSTLFSLPQMYLLFSIEWFFDNRHVLSYEVHHLLKQGNQNIVQWVQQALPAFQLFLGAEEARRVRSFPLRYQKYGEEEDRWRRFYAKVCESDTQTLRDLRERETVGEADELDFQGTLQRQYEIRRLYEKSQKFLRLRKKIALQLMDCHAHFWGFVLRWMSVLHRCSQLVHEFQTRIRTICDDDPSTSMALDINTEEE